MDKGEGGAWHDPNTQPPAETPVIAEYREWGQRLGKKRVHTVWWFDGDWRCYPETEGTAFVGRWRYRAAQPQSPTNRGKDE